MARVVPTAVYGRPEGALRYADGDRAICEECGADWANLGAHAWRSHGLTADEYRARHGIRTSTPLLGKSTAARYAAAAQAKHRAHPEWLAGAQAALSPETHGRARETTRARREAGLIAAAGLPAESRTCPECGEPYLTFAKADEKTCARRACVDAMKLRVALVNREAAEAAFERDPALRARVTESLRIGGLRESARRHEAFLATLEPHRCTGPGCQTMIEGTRRLTCSPECRLRVRQETGRSNGAKRRR